MEKRGLKGEIYLENVFVVSIERLEGSLHVGDIPPGVRPGPHGGVAAGQVYQIVLGRGAHSFVPAVLVYWTIWRLFQNTCLFNVNTRCWDE